MSKILKDRLIKHEKRMKYLYKDSMGYWTIGIGRCLQPNIGKGLSDDEMDYLLANDIKECRKSLEKYDWYTKQSTVRQEALIEMRFNLGLPHLLMFKRMIVAMDDCNYSRAVMEARDSLWAKQIGQNRLNDICYRLEHGVYP